MYEYRTTEGTWYEISEAEFLELLWETYNDGWWLNEITKLLKGGGKYRLDGVEYRAKRTLLDVLRPSL